MTTRLHRSEDFAVEPGERGEVFLECPVKSCPWDAEVARLSLGELLVLASTHLAAVHPNNLDQIAGPADQAAAARRRPANEGA
jgi:hypothetical protein